MTSIEVLLFALALATAAASAACTSAAQRERERLAHELGHDVVAALRAIGSAPDHDAAKTMADALRDGLSSRQRVDVLRLGLGSDDERVVFGAVKLGVSELALPELANAAARALPRLGDPDCPLRPGDVTPLIGGDDIAVVAARVPKLSADDGDWLLGAMHRMLRPDSVPPMCELALTAPHAAVRRNAFGNARMACDYSGEHAELLLTTWLRLHDLEPEPTRGGLAGVLRTALLAHLRDPEEEPRPAEGELDERVPGLPITVCMRWLLASRPRPADLPLLRELAARRMGALSHGALVALGRMDDDASLRDLGELAAAAAASAREGEVPVAELAALARRGDTAALERLFAAGELEAALTAAPPPRRRAFAAALLSAPPERAKQQLAYLGDWNEPGGAWYGRPPYDDACLADLEPMAAARHDLPTAMLVALVAHVPGCRSQRLADALLARPSDELFAADPGWGAGGDLGDRGVWPFLEVTSPDALRRRLREGLRSTNEGVRDACAPLLLRMGDPAHAAELAAWIAAKDDRAETWVLLACDRDPATLELLRAKARAATSEGGATEVLPALAVTLGLPAAFARDWDVPPDARVDVGAALLAGDVGAAVLRTVRDDGDLDPRWPLLAAWPEPRVQRFLRDRRARSAAAPRELVRHDLRWALYAGDEAVLAAADRVVRDGRYAMHYGVPPDVRGRDRSLAALPFWIDELGGNCCRVAVVEEVLLRLFGCESEAFSCDDAPEPARARLRRRLLPVVDRLRWSRIADAWVLAGV